jgi:hypothetical protein
VFILRSNVAPNYSPDEYTGGDWLSAEELLGRLTNGASSELSLPLVVRELLLTDKH